MTIHVFVASIIFFLVTGNEMLTVPTIQESSAISKLYVKDLGYIPKK